MSSNYPESLNTLAEVDHAELHTNLSEAVENMQEKLT